MSAGARRLIVGMSGASGQVYGIRLLEVLKDRPEIETHLVMTPAARLTIAQETDWAPQDVEALAHAVYRPADIGAAIASGSFPAAGMIVAPCSIKSLSAIAHSYSEDLLARAADVQLKEGRPVLLMVRETPLHIGHIRLMARAAAIGCIIFPPVPAFLQPAADPGRHHRRYCRPHAGAHRHRERAVLSLGGRRARTPWPEAPPGGPGIMKNGGHAPAGFAGEAAGLRERVAGFLAGHTTVGLATVGADGLPAAAAVFYAHDEGLQLYFLSEERTRHGLNLAANPQVAGTIQDDGQGWRAIRGLQLFGEARLATGDELAQAAALYARKYAFMAALLAGAGGPGMLAGPLARARFYVLCPHWFRLVDNTVGFGYKEELALYAGACGGLRG